MPRGGPHAGNLVCRLEGLVHQAPRPVGAPRSAGRSTVERRNLFRAARLESRAYSGLCPGISRPARLPFATSRATSGDHEDLFQAEPVQADVHVCQRASDPAQVAAGAAQAPGPSDDTPARTPARRRARPRRRSSESWSSHSMPRAAAISPGHGTTRPPAGHRSPRRARPGGAPRRGAGVRSVPGRRLDAGPQRQLRGAPLDLAQHERCDVGARRQQDHPDGNERGDDRGPHGGDHRVPERPECGIPRLVPRVGVGEAGGQDARQLGARRLQVVHLVPVREGRLMSVKVVILLPRVDLQRQPETVTGSGSRNRAAWSPHAPCGPTKCRRRAGRRLDDVPVPLLSSAQSP